MKVMKIYSHLNGMEYLQVHKQKLIKEIMSAIEAVDAERCRTKESKERNRTGDMLYSPKDMNKEFAENFLSMGWEKRRKPVYVAEDEALARRIVGLPAEEQKKAIEAAGHTAYLSYNETDFVKDEVAVEVQLGKYAFVAHDLFVKHMSFYVGGEINVGVEIIPMKCLEADMSSGVPYFERDLFNIVLQGRGIPAVPLVVIGIGP